MESTANDWQHDQARPRPPATPEKVPPTPEKQEALELHMQMSNSSFDQLKKPKKIELMPTSQNDDEFEKPVSKRRKLDNGGAKELSGLFCNGVASAASQKRG